MRRLGRTLSVLMPSHLHRSVTMSNRDALNSALDEELERDERVFLLGEEIGLYNGAYKVTKGLLEKYGSRRVVDTPITEHGFAGMACGAAFNGLRPVCEFMTLNFSMQAIDQLVNTSAKSLYMSGGDLHCPVVWRGPNGASAGVAAQHSQCLAPWYASVPGFKVFAPYDAEDARGMMKMAIRFDGPVVVLEHELTYGDVFDVGNDILSKDFLIPFGKSKIMKEGTDISIFAFSKAVGLALRAAEILGGEGINVEVVNLRCLRPLDREGILTSVKKTHRVVSVDESFPVCNLGAEIAAMIMESDAFDYLDAPMERVSCADVPTPYAKNLEAASQPQVEDIVEVVRRVCRRR